MNTINNLGTLGSARVADHEAAAALVRQTELRTIRASRACGLVAIDRAEAAARQ